MRSTRHQQARLAIFLPILLTMLILQPGKSQAAPDDMVFVVPSPTANAIRDMFIPPDTPYTVYMVGEGGTILKYRTEFDLMNSGTHYKLNAIHGTSKNNMWAVGGYSYLDYSDANRSVVLHFDGSSWSSQTPPSDTFGQYFVLQDVWADGAGSVYAVTTPAGHIAKKTGSGSWEILDLGIYLNYELNSIYGFSPTDIYAAGGCGVILHYDGTTWNTERVQDDDPDYCSGTSSYDILYDIWGPDADNVFAVGNLGTILKRNAATGVWETIYGGSYSDNDLYSISAISGTSVIFAGLNGDIKSYDGTNLTSLLSSGLSTYVAKRQTGHSAYLLGRDIGQVHRLVGGTATPLTDEPLVANGPNKVTRADRIWLAHGNISPTDPVYSWDGNNLRQILPGFSADVDIKLFKAHSENDIVISAINNSGPDRTKRYNGTAFVDDPDYSTETILDEVKSGSTTATIRTLLWDGTFGNHLGEACVGTTCTPTREYIKLAVATDGKIYAVGKGGAVAVYNGSWTVSTPTTNDLHGVAAGGGQVCAAGDKRTVICKNDSGSWTTVSQAADATEEKDSFIDIIHTGEKTFVTATVINNDGTGSITDDNTGEIYKIDNMVSSLLKGGISSDPHTMSSMLLDMSSNASGEAVIIGADGFLFGNPVTGNTSNMTPMYLLLHD